MNDISLKFKVLLCLLAFGFSFLTSVANAQQLPEDFDIPKKMDDALAGLSGEDLKHVVDNWMYEATECVAYYTTVKEAFRRSGQIDKEAERRFDLSAETLFQMISSWVDEDVTVARLELVAKTMIKQLNDRPESLSIIANEYAIPCKDMVERPYAKLNEWREKLYPR